MQYIFFKDKKGNLRDQNNIVFFNQPNFFRNLTSNNITTTTTIKNKQTKKNKKTSLSSLLRKNTYRKKV